MKPEGKKQKGSRAEREFAKMLREIDPTSRRMVLSGSVMGLEGDIWGKLPIMWEIKNQETWKPLEYYRQAQLQAIGGNTPEVVMTRNREGFYCFLKAEDFIELLKYALAANWPDGVLK